MDWLLRRTKASRAQSLRIEANKAQKVKTNTLTERLVTLLKPNSVSAEAYRTLRTNLLHAFVDNPPKVIVITSSSPGEGKSITCANLAVMLAQMGKNTLTIDCDLRKPELHRYFELRNLRGVVDVLMGERSLHEVWEEPVEGLKVVSAGSPPLNPAEFLGSQRFTEFVSGVREEFDYVLLDAPPIGLVSDPAILATQSDGVLLVIDVQNTRKVSVRRSIHKLETVGANVFGTVVNNVKGVKEDGFYLYE